MWSDHARKLPIFWGTGTADPLVKYELATASAQTIKEGGIKTATEEEPVGLEFHSYEGLVHSADPEELDDLAKWLKRIVPQTTE